MTQATNDLFAITMGQLHQEAPPGLVESLKTSLEQIGRKNPNSAQTAKSCLDGLAHGDAPCSLLKVLTAAYLINGGVMLKYQENSESEEQGSASNLPRERRYSLSENDDFRSLEEELERFGLDECSSPDHHSLPVKDPLPRQKQDNRWCLEQDLDSPLFQRSSEASRREGE